ncbi:MAG: response regulator, partial [Candidatus Thorarchaeota archaeon]
MEDDKELLQSFKSVLEVEGYVVNIAETSRAAFEMVKQRFFDVLLMDVSLPDFSGTELLSLLGRQVQDSVIIMLSGNP